MEIKDLTKQPDEPEEDPNDPPQEPLPAKVFCFTCHKDWTKCDCVDGEM